MKQPNIIFLIFDACRSEELRDIDGNFDMLAQNNISCERALAPSPWSLPSHVSFLTGEHPSSHGVCTKHTGKIPTLRVTEELANEGYSTYGISANSYFSPGFGFDDAFDVFEYTTYPYIDDGLNISEAVNSANELGLNGLRKYLSVLSDALHHDKPIPSLYNLSVAGLDKLAEKYPLHPALSPAYGYKYSAKWNTKPITDIIKDHKESTDPFFICANYMDTHFPYYPREEFNTKQQLLNFRKYYEINERTGQPFKFMESVGEGNVVEEDLTKIRELYRGAVRTVDKHIGNIINVLAEVGLRDNTLLIITADHGENLGEEDDRGYQRMGHHESVSNHHLQVPLVLSHPEIEARTIEQPVESRRLCSVISNQMTATDDIIDELTGDYEHGIIECPATKTESLKEKYPNIPQDIFRRYVREHGVVVYKDGWKMAGFTDGTRNSWKTGSDNNQTEAPEDLLELCDKHLEGLQRREPLGEKPKTTDIDDEIAQQLDDLGYV